MADEALLGYDGEQDLEEPRRSVSRISSLLKARKVAGQWQLKSGKQRDSWDISSSLRPGSWRKRLGDVLESTPAHIVIVVLLLVDLLATALDLLLTIHNTSANLRECTAAVYSCQCDGGDFSGHKSWEFLHWVSVAILGVLLLNVLGLMVAFGLAFFKHPGYVLDLFVVTTALVLEVFFEADTAGLLIILNLWRIVRVAHGIFEVTDEALEKEIDELQDRFEDAHARELKGKDERIMELESELNAIRGQYQYS